MPRSDASSASRWNSELRAMVSAALRDLGYFSKHEHDYVSNSKLKRRVELLWQSNQHIESVRILSCGEYQPFVVTREAMAQISAQQHRAITTPSAAARVPTPPSSSECPEQIENESYHKFLELPSIEELLLDDAEPAQSDPKLPIQVPFIVQYHVCLAVQSTMEAVCFAYIQKHLPNALKERRWDCPESATLPNWLNTLSRYPDDLRLPAGLVSGDASTRATLALHEAALVRRHMPYESLREGIRAALAVVQALGGPDALPAARAYVQNLCNVARQLREQMRELEAVAASHRERLHGAMAEIQAKRAALDKDEAEARKNARKAMAEYEAKWDAEYKAAFAAQETF
ncbi:hypothetical protein CCM_00829 [Cordyceps militaris CM01]|uniref:Ubiquinol-cytochrome-c reductase cytochrome c1 n=1 Tax=Cordyceps militaris (strain CM01) TaxID=983644 RepID=G3J6E0_CORMM|nr:uncharacterized protein CCM_00829 [Cordyceps militaris CM01]EGX96174.1 hypothetical protein CCM_00829 [Cordyceps militaris CM01]